MPRTPRARCSARARRFAAAALVLLALGAPASAAGAESGVGTAVTDARGLATAAADTARSPVVSGQYQPINVNVAVRVGSPGDDGPVVQVNVGGAPDDAAATSSGGAAAPVPTPPEPAAAPAPEARGVPINSNVTVREASTGDTGQVTQVNAPSAVGETGADRTGGAGVPTSSGMRDPAHHGRYQAVDGGAGAPTALATGTPTRSTGAAVPAATPPPAPGRQPPPVGTPPPASAPQPALAVTPQRSVASGSVCDGILNARVDAGLGDQIAACVREGVERALRDARQIGLETDAIVMPPRPALTAAPVTRPPSAASTPIAGGPFQHVRHRRGGTRTHRVPRVAQQPGDVLTIGAVTSAAAAPPAAAAASHSAGAAPAAVERGAARRRATPDRAPALPPLPPLVPFAPGALGASAGGAGATSFLLIAGLAALIGAIFLVAPGSIGGASFASTLRPARGHASRLERPG